MIPWALRAHSPNSSLIDSAVFAQLTTEYPYTLQWAALSLLKTAPSDGGSGPHLKYGSATRVMHPNGISIGSAILQDSLLVP